MQKAPAQSGQLDNDTYNNLKLLYKLSDLNWFIKKHAIVDVERGGGKGMIIDKPTYDRLRILYELSDLNWFIRNHAIRDAKQADDQSSVKRLQALQNILRSHLAALKSEHDAGETVSAEILANLKTDLQTQIAKLRRAVCA